MVAIESGKITIGEILGPATSVLLRNIVPFGLISLLFIGLPGLLVPLLAFGTITGLETLPEDAVAAVSASVAGIGGLIQMAMTYVVMATLIYGTIQDLRGAPAGLGACLSRGLGVLFPLLGVVILMTLAAMLGFVLLIVPGIIVLIVFFVAVPVVVVERPGVFASLGRSRELTKGHRWKIFFMFLLFIAISIGISFLIVPFGILGETVAAILQLILSSLVSAWYAVVSAVTYFNLRYVKEGISVEEIAAVFD